MLWLAESSVYPTSNIFKVVLSGTHMPQLTRTQSTIGSGAFYLLVPASDSIYVAALFRRAEVF